MTDARGGRGTDGDLIVRREGAAGIIRLNRPKAINAMTLEMSRGIDAALDRVREPIPPWRWCCWKAPANAACARAAIFAGFMKARRPAAISARCSGVRNTS